MVFTTSAVATLESKVAIATQTLGTCVIRRGHCAQCNGHFVIQCADCNGNIAHLGRPGCPWRVAMRVPGHKSVESVPQKPRRNAVPRRKVNFSNRCESFERNRGGDVEASSRMLDSGTKAAVGCRRSRDERHSGTAPKHQASRSSQSTKLRVRLRNVGDKRDRRRRRLGSSDRGGRASGRRYRGHRNACRQGSTLAVLARRGSPHR